MIPGFRSQSLASPGLYSLACFAGKELLQWLRCVICGLIIFRSKDMKRLTVPLALIFLVASVGLAVQGGQHYSTFAYC
jgi:hypothetical protein